MSASDTVGNGSWRGDSLYITCLREAYASKQRTFPKGSIRRGETKSLGMVQTPFGCVELSVHKEGFAGAGIDQLGYFGQLVAIDKTITGRCQFSTYRPSRGRGWLTENDIFWSMDAISQEAGDWFDVLANENCRYLVEVMNLDGLLTADEIWIAPDLRGTVAWKALYFCTMSAVFAHQRQTYDDFVFKAHPLLNADTFNEIPEIEIRRQTRQLRQFYSVHLDARVIRTKDGQTTDFMRAPVPYAILLEWLAFCKAKS